MKPIRILFVCPCWPHDKAHGGQLRALQVTRALRQIAQVTLVVAGAHEVSEATREKTVAEFGPVRQVEVKEFPVKGLRARLHSLFSRDFTNIHGMQVAPADEQWLLEAAAQHDLVWFFKLRTANYFRNARWQRSVVDIDDLPSTMEQSSLIQSKSAANWLRTWLRMWQLRRHENLLWRRFDVLATCSEVDRAQLGTRRPVYIIPNGFAEPKETPPRHRAHPPRIGFIGLYNYLPNSEGVRWFHEQCWSRIKQEVPDARLRLIGDGTDGPLKPDDPSVDGLGWVDNPAEEIASWSVMIVPIRIGAGTRVKIADAFSRKCPVVSTRFGALGYETTSDRELILADEPSSFSAACVKLIQNPEMAEQMAGRAYDTFLGKWTWKAITPQILATVQEALRQNRLRRPIEP